ncbi:MAG: hypothetical protein WDM90_20625 [Ferruginibacter sp.]
MKYGVNVPPMGVPKTGQLIIDLDLFNLSKMQAESAFNIAGEINLEIFNVFNWVVDKNLLTLLNE